MTTRRVNDKRHCLTRNPVFYHFTNPLSSKKFTSVVLHESESLRFEIFFFLLLFLILSPTRVKREFVPPAKPIDLSTITRELVEENRR